jgi:hypothetical protein
MTPYLHNLAEVSVPVGLPEAATLSDDLQWGGSVEQCILLCEFILGLSAGTMDRSSNFFAYGGHSLLLSKLMSKLKSFGGPIVQVSLVLTY